MRVLNTMKGVPKKAGQYMKLIKCFIITQDEDGYVAIVAGGESLRNENIRKFNGMIRMNKTAAYIAELMKNETNEETLVRNFVEKFRTDEKIARENIQTVITALSGAGLIQ